MVLTSCYGATKIRIGAPIPKFTEGFEIGINKGILKFDWFEIETGIKTLFIGNESRVLLRKSFPTDLVYHEKQRLYYASVPLDILLVHQRDGFKPLIKFGSQFDILVYNHFVSTSNADLYKRRMSENPYVLRSGVSAGFIGKVLSRIIQVDGGVLFGITPFKNGYGGIQNMNIITLNLSYQI